MLDTKDRKILAELIVNSRLPVTQLAKKVGVSREVALYRINKLVKNKVILNFYTLINNQALGYKRFIFFMQLKGITVEEEKEYLEYLNNHDYVTYMGPIIGKWNAVFDIMVRDDKHFKEVVEEVTNRARPHLESYVIMGAGVQEEIFPTKLVGIIKKMHLFPVAKQKYSIDKTDKQILRLLSTNSRVEYKELSKKIKLSANTIKYRIKNMEKAGIILGYTLSVDYRKLGWEFYNIQLKLSAMPDNKFLSYIRNHKQIVFYYKYLGHETWDIDIGVIAKNSMQLRKIILELKKNFGELIKIHDMYVVGEVIKDNIAPKGMFE